MNEKNVKLTATINEKGFVNLVLSMEGCENVNIKVNDFNGKEKKKAKKLAYKIYCLCNEVK